MINPLRKDPDLVKNELSAPSGKRIVHSEELFKNEREIVIVHGQAQYRLQITKAGKLILNK